MKLAAIAAKYSTKRRYTCKVCLLEKTKLQIVRGRSGMGAGGFLWPSGGTPIGRSC